MRDADEEPRHKKIVPAGPDEGKTATSLITILATPPPQSYLVSGEGPINLDIDSGKEAIEIEMEHANSTHSRTTDNSFANQGQLTASLQFILSVSLPVTYSYSPQESISCPLEYSMALQLTPSDLVGVVLANAVSNQTPTEGVRYLVSCHTRLRVEESQCGKRGTVSMLSSILCTTDCQIISTLANVLRGVWSGPLSTTTSPLYPLSEEQFPSDLLQGLVTHLAPVTAALETVFSPLLQQILRETRKVGVVSSKFMVPLLSLNRLLEVRLESGSRPIVDLLVTQPQWLPADITKAGGLEIVNLSFLGRK